MIPTMGSEKLINASWDFAFISYLQMETKGLTSQDDYKD